MKRVISGVLVVLLALAAFSAFAVEEVVESDIQYSVRPAKSYSELLTLLNKLVPERSVDYGEIAFVEEEVAIDEATEAPIAAPAAAAPTAAANGAKEAELVVPATDDSAESASADGYSKTNVQEQGVDESDIIKTDGKYIYTLRQTGVSYKLNIVKADGKGGMSEVNHKAFKSSDGRLSNAEMFLKNNRLAIIFTEYSNAIKRNYTTVLVYDVSVPEEAALKRDFWISGRMDEARLMEDHLYVVTGMEIYSGDKIVKSDLPFAGEKKMTTLPYGDIYIPNDPKQAVFTTIAAIDMFAETKPSVKSVLCNCGTFYQSRRNMYIAETRYDADAYMTGIVKFTANNGKVEYAGANYVKGKLLNQWAMNEGGGNLRIATTAGNWQKKSNGVYIFDKNMKLTGKVENLAQSERIYSVRYVDDMAYMVTFRETDPLYAIDLSDPANPVVKGKLKIPGFSQYMHPIDDDTLIGFGRDADEKGTVYGIKVSMFDVGDSEDPKELHTFKFARDYYSYSGISDDHKLLLLDASRQLIIFPVTVMSNYGNKPVAIPKLMQGEESNDTFSGLIAVRYDKKTGFKMVAAFSDNGAYQIQRAVYIGDALYYFTDDIVTSYSMDTFKKIKTLELN